MATTPPRQRRFSTSSTGDKKIINNIYVSDCTLLQRIETEAIKQSPIRRDMNTTIVNNNNSNNKSEIQYRKTTKEQKTRRLRLALSCPGILSIGVYEPNSPPTPSKERSSPCEVYDITYEQTNRRNTDTSQTELTETVVKTQPRSMKKYDSCRTNYKDENGNINAFGKPSSHDKSDCLDACLYTSKNVVSYCTCYCCLNALCYHCIKHDDIGYSSLTISDICTCAGSIKTKLKRLAIAASCIPCLPCLTFYPCLNGALNMMIKFRE